MEKRRYYNHYHANSWLLAIIITSLLTACGQSEEKPSPQQQSGSQQQEFEKAPQKLKAIEANIEKIFKSLEGPSVTIEDEKKQEEGQNGQEQQGENTQQQQQEPSQGNAQNGTGQQSQGGEQNNQQQKKLPQPAAKDPWKEIDPIISNLHYQWNDYMPDAVKKGADHKITGNFSNALNLLTNTIRTKDKINTMSAANNLYRCITDLYSLYRTEMSPEIKRVRYLIRNIILDSTTANWENAAKDISGINDSWPLLKNTFGKEQQKDMGKLDFSILELENVVNEKNAALTDIKGRVALSNIQSIEKSYEKNSG